MKDLYENIIIGNFLYSLGLAMGSRPVRVPGCINLLQQTPLDRPLGDVLVHYPGALRLIEFKRTTADWAKEKTKFSMLSAAISSSQKLQTVSRVVHWFVESGVGDTPTLQVSVRPYLDLNESPPELMTLEVFAHRVVSDGASESDSGADTDADIVNEYLQAVTTFSKVKDLKASGLLVSVSGDGALRYVVVENFCDLRMTATALIERSRKIEIDERSQLSQTMQHLHPDKQFERSIQRQQTGYSL